jgi:hypothetical protein
MRESFVVSALYRVWLHSISILGEAMFACTSLTETPEGAVRCPLCGNAMGRFPHGNFPNIRYCKDCGVTITTNGKVPREMRDA